MHPYLTLAAFATFAIVFPLIPLGLARLWALTFSPPKPGPVKNSNYECGIESHGPARIQFHAQYYLYGLIFLIFDVEVLFILPFAAAFLQIPLASAIPLLLFLLLLIEGLLWAWAKGALAWK